MDSGTGEPCAKHGLRWCGDCAPLPVTRQRADPAVIDHPVPWRGPDFAALAELAQQAEDYGPWVTAEYAGTCRGCGGRWEPGDQIRYSEDESSWTGECCGRPE